MRHVTIRVPEETLDFVRREARNRRISSADMWRQLIETGVQGSDNVLSEIQSNLRVTIQALCMSQRVAHHLNQDLVEKAREDARTLIERMETRRMIGEESDD